MTIGFGQKNQVIRFRSVANAAKAINPMRRQFTRLNEGMLDCVGHSPD